MERGPHGVLEKSYVGGHPAGGTIAGVGLSGPDCRVCLSGGKGATGVRCGHREETRHNRCGGAGGKMERSESDIVRSLKFGRERSDWGCLRFTWDSAMGLLPCTKITMCLGVFVIIQDPDLRR
jgi:hypothetical protein